MESPETFEPDPAEPAPEHRPARQPEPAEITPRRTPRLLGLGARLTWLAGLVLALSTLMGWYSGSSLEGPPIAIIGWHTGTLGKLVFFIGLVVVLLAIAEEVGVELPASVPESLVVVALGTLATIFVLVRLISIPDAFADTAARGIGIWISLVAGLLVIFAGLVRAAEEL